jgi:hypothetical protein
MEILNYDGTECYKKMEKIRIIPEKLSFHRLASTLTSVFSGFQNLQSKVEMLLSGYGLPEAFNSKRLTAMEGDCRHDV